MVVAAHGAKRVASNRERLAEQIAPAPTAGVADHLSNPIGGAAWPPGARCEVPMRGVVGAHDSEVKVVDRHDAGDAQALGDRDH